MPTSEIPLSRGYRGVAARALRLAREIRDRDPLALGSILVVVPTAAASHLFRVQLEDALLQRGSSTVVPAIASAGELLPLLARRSRLPLVDPLLREALLERAFEKATDAGASPPFAVRGGLTPRVLELTDELFARSALEGSEILLESFFARVLEELDAPDDEGALKLAAQTRFLQASISAYRTSLDELGLLDVPLARIALRALPLSFECAWVLGDETLGRADLDLLSKADLIVFGAEAEDSEGSAPPRLLASADSEEDVFLARDREESLTDVARLLKALEDDGRLPPLHRVAVVVPRPLPFLYLAKKVFAAAGIPYQLQDSFPLATEPYVAAVDVALELVATDAHRDAALSFLRSPFFELPGVGPREVAAFDELTLRERERGGTARWRALLSRWSRPPREPLLPGFEELDGNPRSRAIPALAALVAANEALKPLTAPAPLMAAIDCLRRFLAAYGKPLSDPRAKAAFDSILDRLALAAERASDRTVDFETFREKLRRAIARHTFAPRTGRGGVQIVDARSAPFGSFDLAILLGLNEGEWPRRSERNVFYPQWLLREFGLPADREVLASERKLFRSLLDLPSKHLALFRHQLEDDVLTVPSPFLEEVRSWVSERKTLVERLPFDLGELAVTRSEALRRGLVTSESPASRAPAGEVALPLAVPEPISPTSFELYLRCPFKYFSHYLLGLEEEEEVEEALSPLDRGRILHELLQEGFRRWDEGASAPRPIEPESYEEAFLLFRRLALELLPPEHRSFEMEWLFGGRGEPGAIPWLLRREMARRAPRERLLERVFQAPLRLDSGPRGECPWYVRVQGRVDRADVDGEGFLHVYDYKSGRAPADSVALQVPLYAVCLASELGLPVREASYLSFRDRKATSRADFETAQELLVRVFDSVQRGRFGPKPQKEHLCASCGFAGVCRKEIAEVEAAR